MIRKDSPFETRTVKPSPFEMRTAIEIGQSFANNVTRRDQNALKKTSRSSSLHARFQRQVVGVSEANKCSLALAQAAKHLGGKFEVSDQINNELCCKKNKEIDCTRERRSKFRNIDGSCNNLRKPKVKLSSQMMSFL